MTAKTQNFTYPDWLDRKEYPFKSHFFQLPMGKMHYLDEGKGDPIVMVHGNPGWSFEFRKLIKALSGNHRCIAPDHIGFGLSDKPFSWDYLPKNHAANLEKFLDSLNLQNITLVVNDWGGPIGLSYALKYPEKIKKLVILNTWMWSVAEDPYYQKYSGFVGGGIGKFLIKNFNFFGKVMVKKVVGDKTKLPKNIHQHLYKHLSSKEDRKGCWVFPREVVASADWLESLWEQRERINQKPTTFIWGMKDIAFREQELKRFVDGWGDAEVIRLEGVGHYPQEEAEEIVINCLSVQG